VVKLLEYEGKRLFARYGIPVPSGALWPEIPAQNGRGLVIKAQMAEGRRGKRGGIVFVDNAASLGSAVEQLLSRPIGGHAVESVYIEERLAIAHELYLALALDRDARRPVLLASRRGGVDIEELAASEIVRRPVDPLLGLRPGAALHVARSIGFDAQLHEQLMRVIGALYKLYRDEEAELVEINPLAVTSDGRLVAADARIVLDDNASFRHASWSEFQAAPEGTAFERRVAELGAVGVEMDGNIAALVSGAGLMMATLDLLTLRGCSVRAAVDLGGTAFLGPEVLGEIVRATLELMPRVLFVNAFFMTASCEPLARAVAAGLGDEAGATRVIARLKGRDLDAARAILGIPVLEDLDEAVRVVVQDTAD
jgi:succinyl-CoA synthetase beta subunit